MQISSAFLCKSISKLLKTSLCSSQNCEVQCYACWFSLTCSRDPLGGFPSSLGGGQLSLFRLLEHWKGNSRALPTYETLLSILVFWDSFQPVLWGQPKHHSAPQTPGGWPAPSPFTQRDGTTLFKKPAFPPSSSLHSPSSFPCLPFWRETHFLLARQKRSAPPVARHFIKNHTEWICSKALQGPRFGGISNTKRQGTEVKMINTPLSYSSEEPETEYFRGGA